MFNIYRKVPTVIALVAAATLACAGVSHSASFKGLKSKGFKVGKITKNRAGKSGWTLKKGGESYFCRSKVSGIIVDSKTLIFMSSSGRQIKADRKTFEKRSGPADKIYPTMSQYRNGQVGSRNVGRCSKVR